MENLRYCNGFDQSVARQQLFVNTNRGNNRSETVFPMRSSHRAKTRRYGKSAARKHSCKHASTKLGRRCFLWGPCKRVISKTNGATIHSPFEAGSNTSTVALRVVRGDEKGNLEFEALRDSDQRKTTLATANSIYNRQTRPLVKEGSPQKQDRNCQMGLDTKTYWLTDRQSQCDYDIDYDSVLSSR
jgi:hypothetical protein